MSVVRKVIDSCRFGGMKYPVYKVLDRMNGSKKAGELRYQIISAADESQYPELLEKLYGASTGEKLHLDAPVTYNEKIQWMKLYDKIPKYNEQIICHPLLGFRDAARKRMFQETFRFPE